MDPASFCVPSQVLLQGPCGWQRDRSSGVQPANDQQHATRTYRVTDVRTHIVELGTIFCVHGAPETASGGSICKGTTAQDQRGVSRVAAGPEGKAVWKASFPLWTLV